MPTRVKYKSTCLRDDFCRLLSRHRKARRLTQKKFADALGISAQRYSRYEKQRAMPSIDLLVNMARILQITADELIGYKPDYKDLDQARRLLKDADIGCYASNDSDPYAAKYTIQYSDVLLSDWSAEALICRTFEARKKTKDILCNSIDSLFTAAYQSAFWQAYGLHLYKPKHVFIPKTVMPTRFRSACQEKEFNKRLLYFRQKCGYSQTDFAKLLGMTNVQAYNRYEKTGSQPTIPLLANMSYYLGISVNLLTGADEPPILGKAFSFLLRVGLDCTPEDGKFTMHRPVDRKRINKDNYGAAEYAFVTENVTLEKEELYFYVSKAWQMTGEVRFDLDEIYKRTFQRNFESLMDYVRPLQDIETDNDCYLYQKEWYEGPDDTGILIHGGPYKTVETTDKQAQPTVKKKDNRI